MTDAILAYQNVFSASFRYREQVISEETNIHRAAYELNETYLVEKLLDLGYETENCLQLYIRLIRNVIHTGVQINTLYPSICK